MKPKDKLISLLTQYSAKQRGKRGYNPHALPLYMQAADAFEKAWQGGRDPMRALASAFTTNPDDETDFCLPPVRQFVKYMGWK